ncbi:hypothetical protein NIES4071_85840 [Calothrix sp. NIES-4071]|nr:hypothetical protein NIES4071_85840 [Calothrix sp. NIES-4071]BAZ62851.1 hypothetical protein NIES4105_85770 [Calothrix sp. NIES-4105]
MAQKQRKSLNTHFMRTMEEIDAWYEAEMNKARVPYHTQV